MTVLVVQAHPLEASYNAALRESVLTALDDAGLPNRSSRLGAGERPTAADLAEATSVILVYPTWSGGLPALLLDWVHEVLDQPEALRGVGSLTAVTTCGSSRFINRVQGEWGKRYLRRSLLGHCAPGARFRWVPLYKIDRTSEADNRAHLDEVARTVVG